MLNMYILTHIILTLLEVSYLSTHWNYNITVPIFILGSVCNMISTTKLPFGHVPLMLYNGEVSCQTLTGKISIMRLNSHIFTDDQGISEDEVFIKKLYSLSMF